MNLSPNKKKVLIPFLFLLIIFLISFTYKKNDDYNDLKKIFVEDKKELQEELNQVANNYKDLTVKNKKLSKRIIKEINKIISLKNSVNELDVKNFSLIRTYRKKVSEIQQHNRELFAQVDSLNLVNQVLRKDNIVTKKILTKKTKIATKLIRKNNSLAKINKKLVAQMKPAKKIRTSDIKAVAMRSKGSGKLSNTSKSNRTDAFKINFKLLKNEITTPGSKNIHIQVQDTKNNVIAAKKVVKLNNKEKIKCSDEIVANYKNEELDVLSLILVDRDDIDKGEYKINVFIDGNFTSSSIVTLR